VLLDSDGFIAVPEGPGIGVTVVEERVTRLAIARERLW
jgi:o-succinylbenzoate synthase